MVNNPKWVVMLDIEHRDYFTDRRKEFTDKKEAEQYYYVLQMSNFLNPYENRVIMSEYSRRLDSEL